MGWIIVGDTNEYNDCLIYTVMGNKDFAEEVLSRMKNNPTDSDKLVMARFSNVRIKETKPENEWWNDPFLAN